MNTDPLLSPPEFPSAGKLLRATALALVDALVILVVAVLPAEYGIDPLGTGKALGLLRHAPEEEEVAPAPPATADAGLEPAVQANVTGYGGPFRVDTVELVLEPYDYLEYKYHLAQGASMVFAWVADAKVNHDFHGEPDGNPNPENVRSYDKSEKRGANGSFTAPMTGIHGWFWENTGNTPVTIKITSAGYFSYSMEFRSDKTRKRHELSPMSAQASAQQ